ncbi:MAG: DegT/DnrJ/EryC1/StrS family aminotransferase [Deltaproteobacteria bacterium]|nr:DegT/DnrJ/EryC1/StrS family aminotransferase [Deltaproteobacteria bacterium]
MKVPLFDMQAELAPLRGELDRAIARVLDSGTLVLGAEVEGFERDFAAATGTAHAVGTSSGTDALLLALMALGVGPGDEVVTTPLTFIATASGAARLGARVVFADVDEALCLDPQRALAACGARTRAIVTVHLHGHPAALPAAAPCDVVEDASHAHGGVRPRARAATYSFFPTKNLGALGDAGAIVTADAALADRARLLRQHGMRPKYEHLALGGNFRLDALQAAVLRVKLRHLAAATAARRAHAERYRALFAAAALPPEVRMPPHHDEHAYHQFCLRAPRREALRAHLAAAGVGTEVYYPQPLHTAPVFAALGYRAGSMPAAERAAAELIALPIHPALPPDAQAYVVEQVARFYRA